MNDPWDVKSVRHPGQYVSCMKINGVPLLPPVLSKECRREMQYYKLLAKEVEKRIAILQPYIKENEPDLIDDKTETSDPPICEPQFEITPEEIQAGIDQTKNNSIADQSLMDTLTSNIYNNLTTKVVNNTNRKLIIDLGLNINETGHNYNETIIHTQSKQIPELDLPERDWDCPIKKQKDKNKESPRKKYLTKNLDHDLADCVTFQLSSKSDILKAHPFQELLLDHEGPSSLSAKSFTGSLNDIHTNSIKESKTVTNLVRQRSYTVLQPSPQLLAHLEVQSLNTGVEVSSISMSESMSSLSPSKKRRSWDLESAKVKWSSMAMELKQTSNVPKTTAKGDGVRPTARKLAWSPNQKPKPVIQDKNKTINTSTGNTSTKSEPVQKLQTKKHVSPNRTNNLSRTVTKETIQSPYQKNMQDAPKRSPKTSSPKSLPITSATMQLVSDSEDPATRVRELYDRIQKQQLQQMSILVEKQKKEQILLQQVFEEQNNVLYKQLKTICPKSPVAAKPAWGETSAVDVAKGPVSLSQLINQKSPETPVHNNSPDSALTDTTNYISHCDEVLKRSKDITNSLKKPKSNGIPKSIKNQNQRSQSPVDGSRTRTCSPVHATKPSTPRRQIKYDTSSSENEYEPMLTDRTNDTMADLNVTFPTDESGSYDEYIINNTTVTNAAPENDITVLQRSPKPKNGALNSTTDAAIRNMMQSLQNSMNSNIYALRRQTAASPNITNPPTPRQLAAASTLVAHARGWLVRRLMATERVQSTVLTIKDALLCALQLHQERAGIRGADVELHRRLIQQITAACYSLHDTFVTSSPAERCALIAADRARRRTVAARQTPPPSARSNARHKDVMSQSHSGAFTARNKRWSLPTSMTQSNYETFSDLRRAPRSRRPWR